MEILYRSFGRARVEQIRAPRPRRSGARAGRSAPRASGRRDEARWIPHDAERRARGPPPAGARAERGVAALADDEQPGRARTFTVPTPKEDLEEHRKLRAMTVVGDVDTEDTTATQPFDKATTTAALRAGAGGATPNPQSVPRAAYSWSVAPPASAPPPLPPEPGIMAPGLGARPQGPHGARPPPSLQRTRTIAGMSALRPPTSTEGSLSDRSAGPTLKRERADRSTHTPAGSASRGPVSGFTKTLVSMTAQVVVPASPPPASSASFSVDETDNERDGNRDTDARMIPPPAPKPGDADGDATEVMDVDPQAIQRAVGQAAQEELHGFDGVPEATPGRHLGPSLETPGSPG